MTEKSRLLWRCRRGIREMDIVFTDFIQQHYDGLSDEEKQGLEELLDQPDLDILNWIMGKDQPGNDTLRHMVTLIQKSRDIN